MFAGGELYLNGSFGALQTGVIGIDGGAEAILPIGDTLTTANIMRAWEALSRNYAFVTDGCVRYAKPFELQWGIVVNVGNNRPRRTHQLLSLVARRRALVTLNSDHFLL
ncbi:hypothetical protein [Bradyrhizobium sp. 131]|uniref:hypothetical protein n=1 Tax=Bradyrhizobium sp. 131 TaxID=2782609 RepID=UPI001FFF2D37|nr:hypothetical protein [Bradyrhizobium sp. 131]UPK20499.1 hypothetical protein IVA73_05400 [Bradyrhizobium sp. 131]